MGSNSLFTVTDIHMSGCQPRGKLYGLSDTVLQGQDCQDATVSWNLFGVSYTHADTVVALSSFVMILGECSPFIPRLRFFFLKQRIARTH